MTDEERAIAEALAPVRVSYLPATFDNRFALDLWAETLTPAPTITDRQAAHLRRMAWRYRRQLPAAIRALQPCNPIASEYLAAIRALQPTNPEEATSTVRDSNPPTSPERDRSFTPGKSPARAFSAEATSNAETSKPQQSRNGNGDPDNRSPLTPETTGG